MNYYSPKSPQNISDTNEVDERWDGDLGYFPHDQSIKDNKLESRFQNMNISREISPPLTSTKKGMNELDSGFFKEDMEQDNYFPSFKSPVIVNDTPPDECDYLTTRDAIHDNPKPIRRRNPEDEQDFSITSLNDLSSSDSLPLENQNTYDYSPPPSLMAYHSGLVQRYIESILRLTDQPIKINALPKAYQTYIDIVRKSCYPNLPNSM
ncbi:hypothetical protein INT47_010770 [Mucor saturninus]|uniref:Uncharacterized protein n=1 Tax=Mucor saturninus TaxID=64648 RepID=A0A8H7R0Q0_9FUNG|nr:hypothetical protein INT47_010770 [Mucor saturninus]